MSVALAIVLLSFIVPIVTPVTISVQSTVSIGESANVSWNLKGGNFDTLYLNLRHGGDAGPQRLTTISTFGQPSGVSSVFFPPDLIPGSYHLQTTIPNGTGEADVGDSSLFALVNSTSSGASSFNSSSSFFEQSASTSSSQSSSLQPSSSQTVSEPVFKSFSSSSVDTNTTSVFSPSPSPSIVPLATSNGRGATNFSSTTNVETGNQNTAIITDGSTQPSPPQSSATNSTDSASSLSGSSPNSTNRTAIIAGAVVGGAILFSLIGLLLIIRARRNARHRTEFYRDRMVRSPGTSTPLSSVKMGYEPHSDSTRDLTEKHPLSYEYVVEEPRAL